MKSQFSKIAKIRKQKRDSIERELIKTQNKEKLLAHKLILIRDQIAQVVIPPSGSVALLRKIAEQKQLLSREKALYEAEQESVRKQIVELQKAYQKAHMDFEKIHYLEEQEMQAFLARLKQQEQSALDEVSTQLFANQMRQKARV